MIIIIRPHQVMIVVYEECLQADNFLQKEVGKREKRFETSWEN